MTAASETLAGRLRPLLNKPGIVERKMFGGTGFMLNGNMAVGTTAKGEMLIRIDPDKAAAALARPMAFRMMMGAREMKGFVGVKAGIIDDPDELRSWVRYALDFTGTLPAK